MRVFSVLYYTDNQQKYKRFKDDCRDGLDTAANKATEVILLESFKDNVPLFPSISALSKYLEKYENNLSDLTVIIDSLGIVQSNSSKLLRAIMIEYPEVKFLFDGTQSPTDIIFRGEPMALENLTLEEDETCLEILNDSIDNSSNRICPKFYKELSNNTDKIWNELKTVLSFSSDVDEGELIKRIRDLKPNLLRTCAKKHVDDSLLKLSATDSNIFVNIVHTRDNLFDASNVRYAIKQWKYAHLRVNAQNFKVIQTSRRDNLVYCVEEEHSQNRFNSYCLFANGFRVLPITCASDLLNVARNPNNKKVSLIIRDYDLQFFDQNESYESIKKKNSNEESKNDNNDSINMIRGFRDNEDKTWTVYLTESPYWKPYYFANNNMTDDEQNKLSSSALFQIHQDSTPTTDLNSLITIKEAADIESTTDSAIPVYFVSKGTGKVSLMPPIHSIEIDGNSKKIIKRFSCRFKDDDNKLSLLLPGIQKPISGVYCPFQEIPEVKNRYRDISGIIDQGMDTTREGHNHGTALDVYAIVMSLLFRSEKYYERGKYVHAAILSNEAIEYLNGFHETLLLKAYQILTVSENAIAMDTIGGDENALKEDTLFRIKKIEYEIDKILRRKKDDSNSNEDRREFKYNVLNQIFSACRIFCKEKEHFSAEDCFISAMAHTNEGFTPSDIRNEMLTICKRILKSWAAKKNDYKF